MKCNKCGIENDIEAIICRNCGCSIMTGNDRLREAMQLAADFPNYALELEKALIELPVAIPWGTSIRQKKGKFFSLAGYEEKGPFDGTVLFQLPFTKSYDLQIPRYKDPVCRFAEMPRPFRIFDFSFSVNEYEKLLSMLGLRLQTWKTQNKNDINFYIKFYTSSGLFETNLYFLTYCGFYPDEADCLRYLAFYYKGPTADK